MSKTVIDGFSPLFLLDEELSLKLWDLAGDTLGAARNDLAERYIIWGKIIKPRITSLVLPLVLMELISLKQATEI